MFELIYKFTCSGCGIQTERRFQLSPDDLHPYAKIPIAILPDDWKIVGGQLFCEAEKVSVQVKSEAIERVFRGNVVEVIEQVRRFTLP